MGQKLHVIRKDKYRLLITAFEDKEFVLIKEGRSKNNYRLNIKEKFSEPAIESFCSEIIDKKLGFSLCPESQFGTYLYTIEKINLAKEPTEELVYGFIEVLPDV